MMAVHTFGLSAFDFTSLFFFFSLFVDFISLFSDGKESCCFIQLNIFSIFVTGMDLFKNLEEVISLWEVSGRSTVLRVLNEVSARIGNTF